MKPFTCRCIGVIKDIYEKEMPDESMLLTIRLKTMDEHNKFVSIKCFDAERDLIEEVCRLYHVGDKVEVEGSPVCDAFLNKKGELRRGIAIHPTRIEFIEHLEDEEHPKIEIK